VGFTKSMPFLLIVVFVIGAVAGWRPVAAMPNAQIQNDSSFTDSLGFNIVGEVLNTGDVWLQSVQVTAVLKDVNGQTVDVIFMYTYVSYLPPGQRAPFRLIETVPARASAVASYSLTLSFQEASAIPQGDVLIVQDTSTALDNLGFLNVIGEVKNSGVQASSYTEVVATFYDQTEKVIYVDWAYTLPSEIPTGASCGFKISGPRSPMSNQVARYSLIAQSGEYSSVPETPWPTIIGATAILLSGIVVKQAYVKKSVNSSMMVVT
jgi:hypothetical protein